MEGWIKLHRSLLKKAIWRNCTPTQCKVLITILLMCNYEEQQWIWSGKKFMVKPGEMITSVDSIAEKCGGGITDSIVRHSIKKFQQFNFLDSTGTNSGRLITIKNWESYQNIGDNVEYHKDSECYKKSSEILSKACQSVKPCNQDIVEGVYTYPYQTLIKPLSPNKKEKNIRINIYSAIFEYWNQKGIIKHRNFTKKIESAMEKSLKEYSEDEILEAINRYSKVYFDKDFYYKHTWTLEKFLKQTNGISNYTDEGLIWVNYKNHKEQKEGRKTFETSNIAEEREKYILC